jgi:hydroxymethylglutaryl-CoA reductase
MKLHARNIAISAGAGGALADKIAAEMTKENNISFSRAKAMVDELTAKNQSL